MKKWICKAKGTWKGYDAIFIGIIEEKELEIIEKEIVFYLTRKVIFNTWEENIFDVSGLKYHKTLLSAKKYFKSGLRITEKRIWKILKD